MTDKLDSSELDIMESFERGEWTATAELDAWRDKLKSAAKATGRKEERVNIRLSTRDLNRIQSRAMEEGIPYQTLISSVLHKYVTGRLSTKVDGDSSS